MARSRVLRAARPRLRHRLAELEGFGAGVALVAIIGMLALGGACELAAQVSISLTNIGRAVLWAIIERHTGERRGEPQWR